MSKLYLFLLGLFLITTSAQATPVGGTIVNSAGTVQGGGHVTFTLSGCPVAQMSSTSTIVAVYTFTALSNGTWSGTVLGNDKITCPGGGATQYAVSLYSASNQLISNKLYSLVDNTAFNPATATAQSIQIQASVANPLQAQGDILIGGPGGVPGRLTLGANGTCLKSNGSTLYWDTNCTSGSGGSSSTLAIAAPSDFTVGAPVTGTGALSFNWVVNPTAGATANAIAKRDSNGALSVSTLTLSADPTANLQAATKQYVDNSLAAKGSGSVNSVGLSLPSIFSTGSPVTTTGNLTATLANQNAHAVFVGPTSGSGTPAFRQLTMDEILPAFSITGVSCSTCGYYEYGQTIASPTNFGITYSSTPSSASITDGTHTVTLTSPFNSGSLAYSYTCTSGVNFTITAVGASTQTNNQSIGCAARTFVGSGAAGATGATASGSNASLSGVSGTLNNANLGNQGSYSCATTGSQKCYILMQGNSHTFSSGGFFFPVNTPTAITFVNQYGFSVSMYLYESTNAFTSSTFNITVTG